jgi:hypothetical protein
MLILKPQNEYKEESRERDKMPTTTSMVLPDAPEVLAS